MKWKSLISLFLNYRRNHQRMNRLEVPPETMLRGDAYHMYHEDDILDTTIQNRWWFDHEYVNDNISLVNIDVCLGPLM